MRLRSFSGIAGGAIAVFLAGAIVVSPVGAHITSGVTHNWNKHYRALAKKLFFTKQQANKRFAHYSNTVLVGPRGTTIQSGNVLRQTVHGLHVAETDDPILVLIEPGEYDLGSTPIVMPDQVSLLGSGRDLTVITCACGAAANTASINGATLVTGIDAEVRSLTVENHDTDQVIHGINLGGDTNDTLIRISDVAVNVSGGPTSEKVVGIWDPNKDVEIRDVAVTSVGIAKEYTGIQIGTGLTGGMKATLSDVTAIAQTEQNRTYGIRLTRTTATIRDTHTRTSEASLNYGVYAERSDLRLHGVHAESVGGGDIYYGVFLRDSDAEIQASRIEARGSDAYGMEIFLTPASNTLVRDIRVSGTSISASGGVITRGVLSINASDGNSGSANVAIENSEIRSGGGLTVTSDDAIGLSLSSTLMSGGATAGAGPITCAGVWDENNSFSASTCP